MTPNPSSNPSACGNCQFTQKLVNQQPVYDRKIKIHRPRKKKGTGSHPKFV